MAGGSRRGGGGERVLESRHLVGLFLGLVVICGVFFTLGYVMGHNQYGGPVHAAEAPWKIAPSARTPEKPSETKPSAAPAPANGEWDFYTKKNNDHLEPAGKPSSPAIAPVPAAAGAESSAIPSRGAKTIPASARFQPPKMGNGAVVLQVAALRHESDALAMADALQQKRFPSFVVTPTSDAFYRVQVGPYSDERSAEAAKTALEHAGLKAIVKR
jgi:DedD protein